MGVGVIGACHGWVGQHDVGVDQGAVDDNVVESDVGTAASVYSSEPDRNLGFEVDIRDRSFEANPRPECL
jgi:hypothetical protein